MIRAFLDATRRNHALEHATISILLSSGAYKGSIAGRSTADGFYVYGPVQTEALTEAAHEALERLQAGEADLAVSPFCGTNIAVASLLTAVVSGLSLGRRRDWSKLPSAMMATTGALISAQPLGRLLQRYVTTSADLNGVDIARITMQRRGPLTIHRVDTRRHAA